MSFDFQNISAPILIHPTSHRFPIRVGKTIKSLSPSPFHTPFCPYESRNWCIVTNIHSTPFVCPLQERLVLLRRADLETAEIAHRSLLRTSSQLLRPSSLVPLVLNGSCVVRERQKNNHLCRQQQQPPSWQRAPEESRSQSGKDGPPRGSGGFNTSYRDLLSLHASGRSVNEHLANKPASSESHSLSVDNVNNSAELSKVRSIANVGNTADLNKTSEHLNDGLGRFKRNGWTTTLQIECACAQSEKRKSHLP